MDTLKIFCYNIFKVSIVAIHFYALHIILYIYVSLVTKSRA